MTIRYWISNLFPHVVNRRNSRRRRRSHMAAEVLEVRALLSTFTVSNINDSGLGSLRAAVVQANLNVGADTIDFDSFFSTAQTIMLTSGQLELSDPATTTITGPAAGVTVSGGGLSGVFLVDLGSTASISGMTIAGGSAVNGGGVSNFGDLTLTNCTISGNTASDSGGGIYISGAAATLTMTSSTVSDNIAANGAGLYNLGGTTTLTNCTISGNTSSSGLTTGLGFKGAVGYDGINPGYLPPDTNAAVNDDWIIETVNVELIVFEKSTGNRMLSETLNDFFAPSGRTSRGDPYVIWDALASHWYVISIDGLDNSNLLLAISNTDNPLDGFDTQFVVPSTDPGHLADYAKFGFNYDSITISANDFGDGHSVVTVIDKSDALAGTLTAVVLTPPFYNFRALVPAQQVTASPGDPIWFTASPYLSQGNTSSDIRVTKLEDPFGAALFTDYSVTVDTYGGYAPEVNQPGGAGTVAANDNSTTQLFEYGNTLVAAFPASTAADGYYYPKVHYYKVDVSGVAPIVVMQGVIDPGPGVAAFFPSAAMNPVTGDLGLT